MPGLRKVSHEEAFALQVPRSKQIHIDEKGHPEGFRWTKNAWFNVRNRPTWSHFLPARFDASKPINMIQIGVFEATDLVWCLQNILKHPKSRVLAIDPWLPTRDRKGNIKLSQERMDQVYQNAVHNLKPWSTKIRVIRDLSQNVLGRLTSGITVCGTPIQAGEWDLIVIDGDHDAEPVYKDACLSLPLARKGGWLLFDDVRNKNTFKDHVVHGLERFLNEHGDDVTEAWIHRYCNCYAKN